MEPRLFADLYAQAVGTGTLGAAAGRLHIDHVERCLRLAWQHGLDQHLQAGTLVERRLLDLERRRPVSRAAGSGEDAQARRTDRADVLPQVPQEDHLGDDRAEAPALGLEHVEDRAIDRFGLQARIGRSVGGQAVNGEFPGLGSVDPPQDDQAAVRLDRLGNGTGRQLGSRGGGGSRLHARTVRAAGSPCCEPATARRR